jgi:tetratricopeptide (TPR) repeat protein
MKGLVSFRTKAGTPEGDRLAKRYGVRSFPSLWVVDAEGKEIDQVWGNSPDSFQEDVRRILRGEDTLKALRARVAESPDDRAARLLLADKVKYARPSEAIAICEEIVAEERADRETAASAWETLGIALYEADRREEAMRAFETLVDRYADTKTTIRGVSFWPQFFDEDADRALAFLERVRKVSKEGADGFDRLAALLHLRAAAAAARREAAAAADDPRALAALARRCLEHGLPVDEAVTWARRAVEGLDRDPKALDVLARLLFRRDDRGKSGLAAMLSPRPDLDMAIALEEEAVRGSAGSEDEAAFEQALAEMRAVKETRAKR